MSTVVDIESSTWFDRLVPEIILEIFDYLSCNDIIYRFFYFNQRYLSYFQFPTNNFSFPLNLFPN